MQKFGESRGSASAEASAAREIKMGELGYINKNCWLAKNLNYPPTKHCQYCQLKFPNCLFFRYSVISLILILIIFSAAFFIEGNVTRVLMVSVFTLIIVYGYFFDRSTESIIEANFAQCKAKRALEELTEKLEDQVTERTKELTEANGKLKNLDEVKSQFIMATQHHLRTPLTAMRGYIDLVLTGSYGKVSKKLKEVMSKLQISTSRELKIVNEMLDISQFQLGKSVITLQPDVDIEKISKEIIEEIKFDADTKGLKVIVEKQDDLPLIEADPEKLRVALSNIIDNAIKYTNQGQVLVKLEKKGEKIKISVKDTGMGIKKEDTAGLFDKIFERGKEAQTKYANGRGIGLFITAHIIQEHGGKIWAESEGEGKGSTFIIELPIL